MDKKEKKKTIIENILRSMKTFLFPPKISEKKVFIMLILNYYSIFWKKLFIMLILSYCSTSWNTDFFFVPFTSDKLLKKQAQ